MNLKILLLVIAAVVGISSYGVLANDIDLDIQKIDQIILPPMDGTSQGETEFSAVQCACRDPDDPDGAYDPGFCNVTWIVDPAGEDGIKGNEDDVTGIPDPNSLGLAGNMLCTWEASSADYGGLLDWNEGCSANYWLKSSDPESPEYSWPIDYQPDSLYEDIFNIVLTIDDDSKEKKIEKLKEKIERFKEKIKQLKNENKIKSQTERSLVWLLNAIPLNDDNSDVVNERLEKFYDRLELFVQRGILHYMDKKYILEVLDDETEDEEHPKFTLQDALSNNKLSPPDKQIAKQSVAALLNSAHFEVNYHYSVTDIKLMTQSGIINNEEIKTANEFKKYNLAGGTLLCSSFQD